MRDTRNELLMQAEILVRGRGYSGFSYADLADAVGIRKASIHHHFRTKEDLGAALVAAYDLRYDEALDAILTQSPDAIARVEAYGRLYLTGVEKGLGCLCAALAVELDTLPPVLRADIARFFDKHIAWLERVLAQAFGPMPSRGRARAWSWRRWRVPFCWSGCSQGRRASRGCSRRCFRGCGR